MDLTLFKIVDLQNFRAMLAAATMSGITDISEIDTIISRYIVSTHPASVTPSKSRKRDNITTCSVCGNQAIILPLSRVDRSANANHVIQCQNRPATDQPWRDGMCGHTEYIVRGDK